MQSARGPLVLNWYPPASVYLCRTNPHQAQTRHLAEAFSLRFAQYSTVNIEGVRLRDVGRQVVHRMHVPWADLVCAIVQLRGVAAAAA